MKDFHSFREAYSIRGTSSRVGSGGGINSGSGDGQSDGQSDSNADRKRQDKDYHNLAVANDYQDDKIRRELINLYGYKKQIANKTVMRANPDIKSISSSGKIVYID